MASRKALSVVIALVLLTATGSALRVYTLETGQGEYQPGQEAEISGFVFNNEDRPIADHEVEIGIAYSPIYGDSTGGGTLRYREYIPLEMNPGASQYINTTWEVPENAPPGSYKIYFIIRNSNEDEQVINTQRFNVTDAGQEVRAASLTDLFFHQGDAIGYSLEGLRVSPNRTANATMDVTNIGTVDLDLNMTMDVQYTYDSTQSAFQRYQQVTVPAGQTRQVVFEFMPPDTPTTYTPIFRAYDSEGTLLGSTNGRLVVRGNSGRILNAGINNNSYASQDTIRLTAELIGPADYSGTIEDATFNYTVEDSEGVLMQGERSVDIGGQINSIEITEDAPRAFANPNVTMVLSKDGRVYDRYTASYSGGEVPSSGLPLRIIAGIVLVLVAAGLLVWRWKQ